MSELQKKLTALVEPLLASLGLELWGLEFLPAKRGILRIYIEKQTPAESSATAPGEPNKATSDAVGPKDAGIDECTDAARLIGLTLDVEDLIAGPYVMEVSTPGLERQFFTAAQLAAHAGELIELSLHTPLPAHPGRKNFSGRVSTRDGQAEHFSLELLNPVDLTPEDAPALEFDWTDLKKARLLYLAPEKPNAPKPKQSKQKKVAKQDTAPQE